jgi:hypothetical protein
LNGASGYGSTLPVRAVVEGEGPIDGYPIPYVLLRITEVEATSRTDNDKIRQVKVRVRVVSEASTVNGAVSELLSKTAQIDDKIEAFTKPTGTAGFENNKWGMAYDWSTQAGNRVMADSELTFSVRMARGSG